MKLTGLFNDPTDRNEQKAEAVQLRLSDWQVRPDKIRKIDSSASVVAAVARSET